MNVLIPIFFFYIPYDAKRFPGNVNKGGIELGANCQYFAFEFLKYFGIEIKNGFRSSELWEDTTETRKVNKLNIFDIVFFNNSKKSFAAHIGVYLGNNKVIHLSKIVSYPTVWDMKEFRKYREYKFFLGAKRVLNT